MFVFPFLKWLWARVFFPERVCWACQQTIHARWDGPCPFCGQPSPVFKAQAVAEKKAQGHGHKLGPWQRKTFFGKCALFAYCKVCKMGVVIRFDPQEAQTPGGQGFAVNFPCDYGESLGRKRK